MENDLPADAYALKLKQLFGRRLGRPALFGLLLLAILPAATIGIIADWIVDSHLQRKIPKTVRTLAEIKQREVQACFDDRRVDVAMLGRDPTTIAFFGDLSRRIAATDTPISDVVLSMPWDRAVKAYGKPVALHTDLNNNSDIRLVDRLGNVIFCTTQKGELGANLNSPQLANTRFAATVRETLTTGRPVFSGFSPDAAAKQAEVAFITAPVGVNAAAPSGVIACKISIDVIARILQWNADSTEGLRIALLDGDLRVLADSTGKAQGHTNPRIETVLTRRWQEMASTQSVCSSLPPPLTYTDSQGRSVTGTCADVRASNHAYALLVEIDRKMAMAGTLRLRIFILGVMIFAGLSVLLAAVIMEHWFSGPLQNLSHQAFKLAQAAPHLPAPSATGNVINHLAATFAGVLDHLEKLQRENAIQRRLMADQAHLHRLLGGEFNLDTLYCRALAQVAEVLALHKARFFVTRDDGTLESTCRFPGGNENTIPLRIFPGEGPVGQTALEKSINAFRKDDIDQQEIPLATIDQANLITVPLLMRESLKGVLELEKQTPFTSSDLQFVKTAAEIIAVALHAASVRSMEEQLLRDNREQAKKLRIREAALESSGRELTAQNQALQASEHKLHLKQLELEAANAQMAKNTAVLEAHTAILEQQKRDMQNQNAELERAHRELAEKARQLERSSQYKTEFMANMSHELRTPLNSILLLSRLLLENKEDNLNDRQLEFARTIHSAGSDLIHLINEILDLAKVESGKLAIEIHPVALRAIAETMQASFAPLAEQNEIAFSIHLAPDLPEYVATDSKRLNQIIKNFLSNAFKFTEKGRICLDFALTQADDGGGEDAKRPTVANWLTITVADTGIGIPADKQEIIFEAFQQVDGSTCRKHGGTGLGLSISRQLTRLLGGTITLESREGEGSRFTIHLPLSSTDDPAAGPVKRQPAVNSASPLNPPPSGKEGLQAADTATAGIALSLGEPQILILINDPDTVGIIREHAQRHGFKTVVADRFATGLHLADYYRPKAIFIDPALPHGGGEAMIQQIKTFPGICHVPVFALMPAGRHPSPGPAGAAGRLPLPLTDDAIEHAFSIITALAADAARTVLVVDPQGTLGAHIEAVAGIPTVRFLCSSNAAEAVASLRSQPVHMVIVDPSIDEAERGALFDFLNTHPPLPLLLFCDRPPGNLSKDVAVFDAQPPNLIRIDGNEALLTALVGYLHLAPENLPTMPRACLKALDDDRFQLKGRKILLADDDMRTVFAVSSVLEDKGMTVITGKNGKESLDRLDRYPDIDLILMDVMMGDVDGYAAIHRIRSQDRYRSVPIIALTAKAMLGDRAKCIAAGADDYLAKPVNLDVLTSMLKIWLNPQLMHTNRSGQGSLSTFSPGSH